MGALTHAEETDNLIMNGGFETGIQFWKGDGKIERLPDGSRVYEIEASKNRMRNITQEFRMKDLSQVEIVFRARSLKYTGAGLRISIHQVGSGSLLWNRSLPEDGSWANIRLEYTRPNKEERRELIIATLLGTGQVQIDDVEVRAPSRLGDNPAPSRPTTPAPSVQPMPPIPVAKPPAPPAPPVAPVAIPAPVVPAGTFGSFEQIVQAVPEGLLKKLEDSATEEGAVSEINAFLAANVKGKPALFRIKVEKSDATGGANKVRFKSPDRPLKNAGAPISEGLWAYFPEATAPDPAALAAGVEVTVSGTIGRCDLTTKGGLRLNVDLQKSQLKAP
jgi:hypothetical protein